MQGVIMNQAESCPVCNLEMTLKSLDKNMVFRGVEISFRDRAYVCPGCGMEVGTLEQTGELQRNISDAYRKAIGLMTGKEIRYSRKRLGMSQQALADQMAVGVASFKRWEGGIIQSRSMDKLLKATFSNDISDIRTSPNAVEAIG